MPVDLYVGGAEHAVLHLLYARFWHKVLFDCGLVTTKEPFQKLVNQGMILGENGEKMSKSRGNVINPDDVVAEWGADSLRLYEMFMGPLEAVKPWQTAGLTGVHRFLKRLHRLVVDEDGKLSAKLDAPANEPDFEKQVHKTVKKVTDDIDTLQFNVAISAMMELVNAAYKQPAITRRSIEALVLLVSPFAPHLAEELWETLGHGESLAYEPWPTYDPALVVEDSVTISVQINGKLRGTVTVPKTAAQAAVIAEAKALESVARHLEGKTIAKEVFVPGKIVSFVVK
jgi:leucyl-tRNA synthetase